MSLDRSQTDDIIVRANPAKTIAPLAANCPSELPLFSHIQILELNQAGNYHSHEFKIGSETNVTITYLLSPTTTAAATTV